MERHNLIKTQKKFYPNILLMEEDIYDIYLIYSNKKMLQ